MVSAHPARSLRLASVLLARRHARRDTAAGHAGRGHRAAERAPAVASPTGNTPTRTSTGDARRRLAARRRPRRSYAWSRTVIYYYETIPAKWDWSLSTAVAKWNASGGRIRFVRTRIRSKATAEHLLREHRQRRRHGDRRSARSNACVRLNPVYRNVDSSNAHNRIEVMTIFAHELGHVLGFQHTQDAAR